MPGVEDVLNDDGGDVRVEQPDSYTNRLVFIVVILVIFHIGAVVSFSCSRIILNGMQ